MKKHAVNIFSSLKTQTLANKETNLDVLDYSYDNDLGRLLLADRASV